MDDQQELSESEKDACRFYDQHMVGLYERVWDTVLPKEQYAACNAMIGPLPIESLVCDSAAGTGALACLFAEAGYHVTCNELADAMRESLRSKVESPEVGKRLEIIEPGSPWRQLVARLGSARFDLVTCLGVALSHCNVDIGELDRAILNMSGLLRPGGYLVVDCKQYSPEGYELDANGKPRIRARNAVEGDTRMLNSEFALRPDRSLVRKMSYEGDHETITWQVQLWPIEESAILRCAEAAGMKLLARLAAGSKLRGCEFTRYTYLTFQRP